VKKISEESPDITEKAAAPPVEVSCGIGEIATGGGADVGKATGSAIASLKESIPVFNAAKEPTGWKVGVENVGGSSGHWTTVAYVVCAR
jgi:hypothetical protein